jgi:hypothetical protein
MIYDKRTGEIIHTHQFFPLSSNDLYSQKDLEKIAMEFLSTGSKSNMEFLGVFHPPKDLDLDPSTNYKINLESQSLISEPIDFTATKMKASEKRDRNITITKMVGGGILALFAFLLLWGGNRTRRP